MGFPKLLLAYFTTCLTTVLVIWIPFKNANCKCRSSHINCYIIFNIRVTIPPPKALDANPINVHHFKKNVKFNQCSPPPQYRLIAYSKGKYLWSYFLFYNIDLFLWCSKTFSTIPPSQNFNYAVRVVAPTRYNNYSFLYRRNQ